MKFIIDTLAVLNLNMFYIIMTFWDIWVKLRIIFFNTHYFIIPPLSVLKVQKGFTRPFIFKNTEVLPVLKGLCKILIIKKLDLFLKPKNSLTIVPTLIN